LVLFRWASTGMLQSMCTLDTLIWESWQNRCSCISGDSRSFDLHSGFV
jgi:hypothetical protein